MKKDGSQTSSDELPKSKSKKSFVIKTNITLPRKVANWVKNEKIRRGYSYAGYIRNLIVEDCERQKRDEFYDGFRRDFNRDVMEGTADLHKEEDPSETD